MKHFYYCLGLSVLFQFSSCTPEFQAELEQMVNEAKITYYVSPNGNDSNSGNSPQEAWKTIHKINSTDFVPGSRILFQGGATFAGNIYFSEADGNDAALPVQISSYGTGQATIQAGTSFGIFAYNTAGFEIDNLIIAGSGMHINKDSGIHFYNDLPGDVKLQHIQITNCEVYGFREYGIVIGAYNGNSGFDKVLIENNKVHDCLDTGISSYGEFSQSKTGYAHSNITVRKCEVYNIPGFNKGKHSGNGIVLGDVQNSIIEYSTVYNCGEGNTSCGGPVGIWYWDSDRVTIQHCEAYNISSGTGCDGGGFDMDGGVTNGLMQYNYSHDNDGGGFLVGQFTGARPMNNIIVRYNISQNDAATNGGSVYLFNGDTAMDNIFIYNNTFYITEKSTNTSSAAVKLQSWKKISGNINIWNNILYTGNGADALIVPSGYSANFRGNLYYSSSQITMDFQGSKFGSLESFRTTGNEILNGQPVGFEGDPGLSAPGAGDAIGFGRDLRLLEAYKLISHSPAKDKGININDNIGDRDYFGNFPIRDNNQDIGAHEL